MLLHDRGDHRAAGIGGHRQLRHIQRIDREYIAVRGIALSGAGAVIRIFTQIGSALQRSCRQCAAMIGPGTLGKFVVVFGRS